MTLVEKIMTAYPELKSGDFDPFFGKICVQNDGDDDYIAKWEYSKPIPEGLKLGK